MIQDGPDPAWAERLRNRCHTELARRARDRRAGSMFDVAAVVAVCAYVAAVFAVVLRSTAGS